MAALYVTADALDDVAQRGAVPHLLSAVAAIAAVIGLLQVAVCPGPAPDTGTPAWLYHRCHRARGPFSIYMTLAGILTLMLLATLPRLLPGARRAPMAPPALAHHARRPHRHLYARGLARLRRRRARALAREPPRPRHPRGRSRRARPGAPGGAAASSAIGFVSMGDPEEATVKERRYMWESGSS